VKGCKYIARQDYNSNNFDTLKKWYGKHRITFNTDMCRSTVRNNQMHRERRRNNSRKTARRLS